MHRLRWFLGNKPWYVPEEFTWLDEEVTGSEIRIQNKGMFTEETLEYIDEIFPILNSSQMPLSELKTTRLNQFNHLQRSSNPTPNTNRLGVSDLRDMASV